MKVPDTDRIVVTSASEIPSVGTPFQTADFLAMLLKSDDAFFLSNIVEKNIAGVSRTARKNDGTVESAVRRRTSMDLSTKQ